MTSPTAKNRFSIFLYEGNLGRSPTVINLAKLLNKIGSEVDIYAGINSSYTLTGDIGAKTKIKFTKHINDPNSINFIFQILGKIRLWAIVELIEIIFFVLQVSFAKRQSNQSFSSQNEINIGVDKKGSILCLLEYYLFKRKYVYLSLEIYHPNTYGKLATISTNPLSRLAYRNAELVVVQDEDRLKSLCEYNQYNHPHTFYLPNSPMDSNSSPLDKKDNYFQNTLNLSDYESPCLLMQAGMISDLVCCTALAKTFASIDCKKSILIFHSSEKRELDEPYMKELKEINSHNLLLSLNPVPYDKIDTVFASVDIGLAFYKDIDNNFSQIAMASGKLANYLKHGKPVLVNNLASLSKLVDKHKIGIVIQDLSDALEIELAIDKILENYAFYSENARKCFEEEYDFGKKAEPILSYINQLYK